MKEETQHFEHIDAMTQEFGLVDPEKVSGPTGEWWHLRILLAIAQQLSVISSSLKKDRE